MKRAFTIVELLVVIGIIAVLMGIVTTAASSSIRNSRRQRANALCALVQAGLATYREQKGTWPEGINLSPKANDEGGNGQNDPDSVVLSGKDVRTCVRALVHEAKLNNPMMDISGLFVSREEGELNGSGNGSGGIGANESTKGIKRAYGLDFMSAIKGTRRSKKRMKVSEMYFGYPDPETGYFLRFKIVYSIPTDSMTVSLQR